MQVISMTEGKITQDYISRFPVGNPVGDKQIGHVPVLLRISMPRCSPITFGLRIMWRDAICWRKSTFSLPFDE